MNTKEIENLLMMHMMRKRFPIFAERISIVSNEYDVVGINSNGYVYEFEIKQSRSDFKADFKKTWKHRNLKTRNSFRIESSNEVNKKVILIPNRFFYVCNEGLIRPDEVPEYSGLIYISNGEYCEIKNAPLLHKEKANENTYKAILTTICERSLLGCAKLTFLNNEKLRARQN